MGFQVYLGFGADDYCISTQEHSGTLIFRILLDQKVLDMVFPQENSIVKIIG
jgi:hypothetical protein